MRGNARSSANLVTPVTFATASILRCALPTTLWPAIERLPRRLNLFASHAGRGELDRFVDLDVTGAATEVAREGLLDLLAGGFGVRREQGFGGKEERGGAVAALRRPQVGEGLLERVQPARLCHSFHRF